MKIAAVNEISGAIYCVQTQQSQLKKRTAITRLLTSINMIINDTTVLRQRMHVH